MSLLLERLRGALSPQFTVERELAGGGMGIVFLGHDVTLDRPVAIKVLRPEQATAVGVERFLREARLLARLRHPNIVPVFQGGDAGGLLYHILEYQAGETLAQRLARGRLTPAELEALADGLLAALATAHAAGVVHRDIKPSNIFLVDGRPVVGDFGIAHTDTGSETLTDAGATLGTRAYMAPEQWRGGASTPRTDLYSAALVITEAATGRPAAEFSAGGARLAGMPARWARPLRRALSEDPGARWRDAASFLAALRQPRWMRPVYLLPLAAAVAVLAWMYRPVAEPVQPFTLALRSLAVGVDADSSDARRVEGRLLAGLTGLPDIQVTADGDERTARATLQVTGGVHGRGTNLQVRLELSRPGRSGLTHLLRLMPRDVPTEDVDALVHEILLAVWQGEWGGGWLPVNAAPHTPLGLATFLAADRAYAAGQYSDARQGYMEVIRIDSSCALCGYRIRDLNRWLNEGQDSQLLDGLIAVRDRFPTPYQELIDASNLPPIARLQRLDSLLSSRHDFFDFRYQLGDELLHRGPLHGQPRNKAIEQLQQANRLRPEFTGVVEHLLWARIAEGDSARAATLLLRLDEEHEPQDKYTRGLRALHHLAFRWRFFSAEDAALFTRRMLADPILLDSENLPAGPRMLSAFGAPAGGVGMGALFAGMPERPELRRAGLVAQALGWTALGRPDSAARAARALARADPTWLLFELELTAWLVAIGEIARPDDLLEQLDSFRARRLVPLRIQDRATFWLAMLDPERPSAAEGLAPALSALVRAEAAAREGDFANALALSDPYAELEYREVDAFAGALARLRRAEWLEEVGRRADALQELLWHEHSDLPQIPRGDLQAAEVDWAAATLAIWRRAHLLAAEDAGTEELCQHWREVIRRWSGGMPAFAKRADSARRALSAAPQCQAGR